MTCIACGTRKGTREARGASGQAYILCERCYENFKAPREGVRLAREILEGLR